VESIVYYLNVSINGYDAEVFVNGAPILTSTAAYPCIAFPTVSEWMASGENEIKVVISGVAPPPSPPPKLPGEEEGFVERLPDRGAELSPSRVKVALCQGEMGTLPELGQEDVLGTLEWSPPGGGAPPLPAVATLRREVSHPYGRWSWQDADPISLDRATVEEITGVVRSIHAAMAARRVEPLADLMDIKFDEVGRCYDLSPEEAEEKMAMGFEDIFETEGWDVADLNPDELDLRLCCGDRVVEVRNKDGRPSIRQREPIDEGDWAMPIFLARHAGRFVVVR
jgi:hypothetical protein